jgi:REP element-mobilizing transposase RayT
MARKSRVEVEGDPYHIITRGNNRQLIFGAHDDYIKMLMLLDRQKTKLAFFLCACCLMRNHMHLLIREATRRDQPRDAS